MSELIRREDAINAVEMFFKDAYIEDSDVHCTDMVYEINHIPAASPWHRVEEELPEKFVNVILANKRGKHYDIDKGWWNGHSFDRCAKGIYRNVTNWMPLPEPPKEDADGNK